MMIDYTKNIFNSYNKHLQFTVEESTNNRISFLDLLIIIEADGYLITDWYRKPTYSSRYLNFHSHHPEAQIISGITMLVDKMIKLSDKKFHEYNFAYIKNILKSNDYPEDYILKHIKKRLYFHKIERKNKEVNIEKNINLVIPFTIILNKNIRSISNKFKFNIINSTIHKFNFVRLGKDRLDRLNNSNVVYKINCNDCNGFYIGQTSRLLKIRLTEHEREIKNKKSQSAIFEHASNYNHSFKFDNFQILDIETQYYSRLFSEMINIVFHDSKINRITDTHNLRNNYKHFLKMFKKYL